MTAPVALPPLKMDAEAVGTTPLLARLLPEISVAVMALACALVPRLQTPEVQDMLAAVIFLELVFCLGQGTLTDLATRLRTAPPAWFAIALGVGFGVLILVYAREVLELARELGWVLLLGILWSGAERLREIWTMPSASRAEKLRRRALVGGRIELVLAAGAGWVLIACATYLIDDSTGGFRALDGHAAGFVAAFFSLTAFDVWRVHRPAFLLRPRSLLRIDPLGIEYLAPL